MGGHRPYITDHLGLRLVVVSHYTIGFLNQIFTYNSFLNNLNIFYYFVIPESATRGIGLFSAPTLLARPCLTVHRSSLFHHICISDLYIKFIFDHFEYL